MLRSEEGDKIAHEGEKRNAYFPNKDKCEDLCQKILTVFDEVNEKP